MDTTPRCVSWLDPEIGSLTADEMSNEERQVVDTINHKVAAARSLDEVMDFIFEATRNISPCDRVGLAFVEADGQRIKSWYARASYHPLLLKRDYAEDLSSNTLGEIIFENKLRLIHDLKEYSRHRPESHSTALLLREGVRSSMTCPLSVDERNVGVFFRSSRTPNIYDSHQARLYLSMAERLSQTIEKAYRIEQLTAANRAYFETLSFVTHELKAPVASLVSDATLLGEGYFGELNEAQQKKIEGMVRRGNFMLGLTREYLDLARIEGRALEPQPRSDVEFSGEVIDAALDQVQAQIDYKGMTIEVSTPDDIKAECDPHLLRIVVLNLLSNAVKYGEKEIRLTVEQKENSLHVEVWNDGAGFREEDKRHLFRKFSRLENPGTKRVRGTGVGLYNSWRIVKTHGGRIWADSEPGEWASFTFSIPQPLPELESDSDASAQSLKGGLVETARAVLHRRSNFEIGGF
ncbi:MAG: ATP-binding protein [Candidatus Sumerlaeota bacterium]